MLKASSKIVIVDYAIRQNPLLEAAQLKEERTIEEMQPTVFDARYYEHQGEQMYFYPEHIRRPKERVLVESKEFEGLGLDKNQLVAHVRELRSLGYQILNALTLGNTRTSQTLLTALAQNLPATLIKDALTSGLLGDSE